MNNNMTYKQARKIWENRNWAVHEYGRSYSLNLLEQMAQNIILKHDYPQYLKHKNNYETI